ncbi:gamma-glutamyltranspeptidase/glutathione hydrolase [Stella humosa]|uniref:Gamma-glutamyltranspeptidase/glutathione hydrolase n=1 Tax=Stella humosa TaxID=94 RepID=A0A3N1MFL9_9PROT|nr:gamma-glutamyltransferase [Stella humosa]ROQ01935.1 gamma-glutamyltranspeptidase/glutathione hydrolase [Stella humosa]BBK32324.1 gamma-glutamyltransferase [Stella humosa]
MFGRRPTISSVKGMVASANPHASMAGARLLRAGGNAFDAIAATAAALNVAEPYMSGLAGMGMATCYVAREKRVRTLDFITPVPAKFDATKVKRKDVARGPMASGAPGNLAGWCELVKTYGSKPLADIFAPAIELAREGIPVSENNADNIGQVIPELATFPGIFEGWSKNYTGGTGKLPYGSVLKQPDLARTYEAIAAEGPGHLYGGALGREMVGHLQSLGGVLSMADLEAVKPLWLEPLSVAYRGIAINTLPPPCEGFQYLLTLRILEGFDLGKLERNGLEHLDIVFRAIRLAAGERIYKNNPSPEALAEILGDANVDRLRQRIRDPRAVTGPTEQWIEPQPEVPGVDRDHTTSFSVADAEGNVVCITMSLGAKFGSGVVIPGRGVCMNNFLYWGELDPRGGNFMKPGGPLALPTAPSIGLRADGKPVLALGTPGSYGICQTQSQAMVQHVDFGLPIQEAIAAPRARLLDGAAVHLESRINEEVLVGLRGRGHQLTMLDSYALACGGMQGIAIDPDQGVMTGGADPRRDGYAICP